MNQAKKTKEVAKNVNKKRAQVKKEDSSEEDFDEEVIKSDMPFLLYICEEEKENGKKGFKVGNGE